jgi:hypothetical protein
MKIDNRAAEKGGEIIADAAPRTYKGSAYPVMAYAIVDSVINTITSPTDDSSRPTMKNMGYYDGRTVVAGEFIYGYIASIQLTSGAVQVIF